jgi:hypothetical protein
MNHLPVHGVVDARTAQALADFRAVTGKVLIFPPPGLPLPLPDPYDPGGLGLMPPIPLPLPPPLRGHLPIETPRSPAGRLAPQSAFGAPPTQPAAPPVLVPQGVNVGVGQMWNLPSLSRTPEMRANPSLAKPYFSPYTFNLDFPLLLRLKYLPDVTGGIGGQFAINAQAPSNVGTWTATAILHLGVNSLHPFGPFDLFNPAVVWAIQKNQAGTWADAQYQAGISNTSNWWLLYRYDPSTHEKEPRFGVFANAQVNPLAKDFHGKSQGVPVQLGIGVGGSF